jgi:hypothetical protein
MNFLLQSKNQSLDIDTRILENELRMQKRLHSYKIIKKDFIDNCDASDLEIKQSVPVGDLDFVSLFLQKIHGVKNMNPIEVPEVLRRDEFLKREYSIVEKKDLPKRGRYFTKYVSKLKVFSHTGLIETLQYEEEGKEPFLKDGLYQVSEVVDIVAEYRCFIHNNKLIAINYYDGDCTIYPDSTLIKKAILMYQMDPDRPAAYTMDIAVIRDRGTAILEIHPWVSVGLYGYVFGSSLPYCYRDGFRWYVEKNKEINKSSNF